MISWLRNLFGLSKPKPEPSIIFNKPSRNVRRVFIHCSDSNNPKHDDVSVIRKWHMQERGWNDVGYHYFIQASGVIQAGRPLDRQPAAQYPHNKATIAICLHGKHKQDFTEAQFKSLNSLCRSIADAYNNNITFHGHCEVSAKACPVFDYKKVLNLSGNGFILQL